MDDPRPVSELKPSLQDRLEYLLLRMVGFFVGLLPRSFALLCARPLGIVAFDIVRFRRRITLENLEHAFPEKSRAERTRIGRAAFVNLALVVMEMLRAFRMTRERVLSLVQVDSESESLYHRLVEGGRGVIFVGGHYSTWEFLAARVAATGYPTLIIVQDQRNPLVNRDLIETRRKLGFLITGRGQAVRSVLKTLKDGGTVGILADQDAGRLRAALQMGAAAQQSRRRQAEHERFHAHLRPPLWNHRTQDRRRGTRATC